MGEALGVYFSLKFTRTMADDKEKGMALFAKDSADDAVVDTAAAETFKSEQEAAIKTKEDHAATLTGKANKNERAAIGKEVSAMKADPKYVDACKIAKGLPPPNGNFATKKEAPKAAVVATEAPAEAAVEKKDKAEKKEKPKKTESAGISREEKAELDSLKEKIITKKAELKAQGKSGGQCNKDPDIVQMVARMQELKIKEDPTLADADAKKGDDKKSKKKLSAEQEKDLSNLETEIETYRQKLVSEFGYSKKDIAADPDMQDMQKKLAS